MRKLLIPLLVASAFVPAAASAQDGGFRGHRNQGERASEHSAQRDNSSNDRPQRAARAERSGGNDSAVRTERAERPVRVENSEPVVRSQDVDQPVRIRRAERPAAIERVERIGRNAPVVQTPVAQTNEPVEQDQSVTRSGNEIVDALRATAREQQLRRDGNHHWDGNRDGKHRWSGEWRHDHRYDWRGHRSRYGSLYRFGRYYDPYGWGYRRFSIGLNLWPSYYGSSFWLNDPWQYRLPQAYGPYQWVRYYDDALLVNIYTGQVVDVVYNFFW